MDGIYLAISMTTRCNLNCFYCKPTGESISTSRGTIPYDDFCRIVKSAYRNGIKKFRLTGGECTSVPYFADAILYIINLGEDTRINICTNGYRLSEYIQLIGEYHDRINVRISVDSLSEYIGGFHFPKYLSERTKALVTELIRHNIETRFNIVVTSYNISEIVPLIEQSLLLGVNIKLLDLYVQDIYLGGDTSSFAFWEKTYQSLTQFIPYLEQKCSRFAENYWDDSAYGIPMNAYFYGKQSIVLKDSSKGAHFSKYCMEKCSLYNTCQEGIYVPFLSVGNIIHINGCHNDTLRWNLSGKEQNETDSAFEELLEIFTSLTIRKESSRQFRKHVSYIEKD